MFFMWLSIFVEYIERFVNIFMLVEKMFVLLLDIVCCECGLCILKYIKLDWRLRLKIEIFDYLMRIFIDGLDLESYNVVRVL